MKRYDIKLDRNNWVQYRCNPLIMPFAGLFGKPVGSNFLNCLWVLVKKYAGFLLMPIKYITKLIHNILKDFGGSINMIRKMTLQIIQKYSKRFKWTFGLCWKNGCYQRNHQLYVCTRERIL